MGQSVKQYYKEKSEDFRRFGVGIAIGSGIETVILSSHPIPIPNPIPIQRNPLLPDTHPKRL